MLADATQHSLVLLDELGKGTEVSAGAAIAGALVEALDRVACKARPPVPAPCRCGRFNFYTRNQRKSLHSYSPSPRRQMSNQSMIVI